MAAMAKVADSHATAVRECRRARRQTWLALALAGVAFGSSLALAATGIGAMQNRVPTIPSASPGLADTQIPWLPDIEPPGTAAGPTPLFLPRAGRMVGGQPAAGAGGMPDRLSRGQGIHRMVDSGVSGQFRSTARSAQTEGKPMGLPKLREWPKWAHYILLLLTAPVLAWLGWEIGQALARWIVAAFAAVAADESRGTRREQAGARTGRAGMKGREWTENRTGVHRRRHRGTGRPGSGRMAARRRPRAGRDPGQGSGRRTRGIHPNDLFGRYLSRLCDCGDRAAIALRSELTEPGGTEPPGSAVRR